MKNQNLSVFGIDVSSLISTVANSPYFHLMIAIIIALGVGVGYGLSKSTSEHNLPLLSIQSTLVTRAEYERLQIGMQLVEAEAILGRGDEIKRSTQSRVFLWKNPNGSKITVTFTDDKLTQKEQTGL